MVHNHGHTNGRTEGQGNSMTKSAQWGRFRENMIFLAVLQLDLTKTDQDLTKTKTWQFLCVHIFLSSLICDIDQAFNNFFVILTLFTSLLVEHEQQSSIGAISEL